jgi:hypothetical protein
MKPRLNEMETSRRALLTALGVVGLTALGPAVDGPRSDAELDPFEGSGS